MALKFAFAISGSTAKDDPRPKAPAELYVLAILKRPCQFDLVLEVGDPQTYALLHCSVFKERTQSQPEHSHADLNDRVLRPAARVTTAIISPGPRRVKESFKVFFANRRRSRKLASKHPAKRVCWAGNLINAKRRAIVPSSRKNLRPTLAGRGDERSSGWPLNRFPVSRACATSTWPGERAAGSRGRRPCCRCPTY